MQSRSNETITTSSESVFSETSASTSMEIFQSKIPPVPIYLTVFVLVILALMIVTLPLQPWTNVTFVSVKQSLTGYQFHKVWMDYQTAPDAHVMIYDHGLEDFVNDTVVKGFGMRLPMEEMFTNSSSVIESAWIPSLSTTHPIYTCSVGYKTTYPFDNLLESMGATDSTNVFLMDSLTGSLIATLTSDSNDDDSSMGMVTPENTNDTFARDVGRFLKGYFGDYYLIPNANETVSIETKIGGVPWLLNYRFLDRPNTWLVVVGIPDSEFFSKTDSAKQTAIIVSSLLSAFGVSITVFCSWVAMKPLHTLTIAMEKLTKMDFTALEGDILNQRSFMLEIRRLQVTFATMCKAFASGIRRNKSLPRNSASGGGRKSTSHTRVTSNDSLAEKSSGN
ncbi:hypothetical protein HDU76_001335 [Blyttiomyces sp. JEL0837]|nr:hypothetical protein HDU76_001335 [Blyttiomyces sp. JEL0837]